MIGEKHRGIRLDNNELIVGQLIHKDNRTFIVKAEVQFGPKLSEDYVIVRDCYEVDLATTQPSVGYYECCGIDLFVGDVVLYNDWEYMAIEEDEIDVGFHARSYTVNGEIFNTRKLKYGEEYKWSLVGADETFLKKFDCNNKRFVQEEIKNKPIHMCNTCKHRDDNSLSGCVDMECNDYSAWESEERKNEVYRK